MTTTDTYSGPQSQSELYRDAYDHTLRSWDKSCDARFLETAFGRTHVLQWGKPDGPPLLRLHGAGDSSTMWYANAKQLGEQHRVYAVDIIGDWGRSELQVRGAVQHGRAARTVGLSQRELADWIAEVILMLELERPDVLGFSFGGFLPANFTLHKPALLDKLILLAPAATLQNPSFAFFVQSLSAVILRTRSRAKGFLRWQSATGTYSNEAFFEQAALTLTRGLPRLKMQPTAFF